MCVLLYNMYPMKSTKELTDIIRQAVDGLSFKAQPDVLYDPMSYMMGLGGKRVRPLLCLMAFNMYSDDLEKAINPALAIEMFHNFTLLHDDVMDRSYMRRGKPCVHVKWDENTAILSGDALQVVAYQYMQQAPADKLPECMDIFSRTALEVCEGQAMDMLFESTDSVGKDDYLEMVRLKTAVLLAGSLKIWAVLAGAPSADADRLYDFGINIGIAFQIKDDVLDVWGNAEVFGKAIGGDIMCNKKTFPLLYALEKADDTARRHLQDYMRRDDLERAEKIQTVTDIYNSLGVHECCDRQMQFHFDKAMASLDRLSVDPALTEGLRVLAKDMMDRQI